MQHRILILVCLFFGLTTAFAHGEESEWQATLRSELQRCSDRVELHFLILHFSLHSAVNFQVIAPAAKILEERRREELLPYLSELRKNADQIGKDILDEWTTVVSKGLHGVPSSFKIGEAPKAEEVATRAYSVPDFPVSHHP